MKNLTLALSALVLSAGLSPSAQATNISYNFTATTTGNVSAYFVSESADDTSFVGLNVNGVSTGIWALNNQTSSKGNSFNFGSVNAGDVLTFKLFNKTQNQTFFSDASLNNDGKVHIQTSDWTGTSGKQGIPAGLLVAFEDRPFPGSDFDFNDAKYVFTNVSASPVPVPAAIWLFGSAMLGFLGIGKRNRSDLS